MPDPTETDFQDDAENGAARNARDEELAQAKPTDDVLPELDDQARDALEHRAKLLADQHITAARVRLQAELEGKDHDEKKRRWSNFHQRSRELRKEFVDRAVQVYEDAKQRRGAHQAAIDQMQAGIGLPVDPAARQAEIERRERDLNPPGPIVNIEVPATHSAIQSKLLDEPGVEDPSVDKELAADNRFDPRVQDENLRQRGGDRALVNPGPNQPPAALGQALPNPFIPGSFDTAHPAGSASGADKEAQKSPEKDMEVHHGNPTEAPMRGVDGGLTPEQLRERERLASG